MIKEAPHLGLYQWTDAEGNLRPTAGSVEGKRRSIEHEEYLEAIRKTPEYEAWVKKHGFTK